MYDLIDASNHTWKTLLVKYMRESYTFAEFSNMAIRKFITSQTTTA